MSLSFDPNALATLGAGALDIIGGQLSAGQNRQTQRAGADLQRDFAKNGIQWKVEDANKAGIHPLYALGSFPSSANPITLGDPTADSFANAGQNLSRAASMGVSQDQRNRTELENTQLLSQIEETDARKDYILAQTAQLKQGQGSSIGIQPETPELGIDGQAPVPPGSGVVDIQPSKITSASKARASMEAGIRPGEEQRSIGGLPILLPELGGESSEEIISEMSPLSWSGLLARNSKLYGKGWLNAFLKMRYLGIEPNEYYPNIQEQQKMSRMYEPKNPIQKLPGQVGDAVDRAIGTYRTYKRRYKRWSKEHPSGRG